MAELSHLRVSGQRISSVKPSHVAHRTRMIDSRASSMDKDKNADVVAAKPREEISRIQQTARKWEQQADSRPVGDNATQLAASSSEYLHRYQLGQGKAVKATSSIMRRKPADPHSQRSPVKPAISTVTASGTGHGGKNARDGTLQTASVRTPSGVAGTGRNRWADGGGDDSAGWRCLPLNAVDELRRLFRGAGG